MSQHIKKFNFEDLENIIKGAHFFACGGGGALENGNSLLNEVVKVFGSKENVEIKYIDPQDVEDTSTLPVLAAMGAPKLFLEKGYGQSPITAFDTLQSVHETFTCLSPVETGPIAYGMSLLVAASKNIPIINGDGGGRAFPCLQLSTFANDQLQECISVGPCALTSEKSLDEDGGAIIIDCKSSTDVDAMARGIISMSKSFDDRASLASFVMTGKQLKQANAVVPNMFTSSLSLGQNISHCQRDQMSCFAVIDQLPGAVCRMQGKLTNIVSNTIGGFDWVVQEYSNALAEKFYVISQNENLLLWTENKAEPIAMAPDLICCISSDATLMSNDEILNAWVENPNNESLKSMAIYTIPAAKQIQQPWFHQQFATIFKQFGYFGCYQPPLNKTK